jgi:hypothetical protein
MSKNVDLLKEIRHINDPYELLKKYVCELSEYTNRNTIIYYSGWLQKPQAGKDFAINDQDKNELVNIIQGLDLKKGLDLILHTPGGDAHAVESIIYYLNSTFNNDIRAIVPQLAMSGGTMIACSCKSIVMGEQSSLGPIDPQIDGTSAHLILDGIKRIHADIKINPQNISIWQYMMMKYPIGYIAYCERQIEWSEEITEEWLINNMLKNKENSSHIAKKIIQNLTDPSITKSHSRHIPISKCKEMGLNIEKMEDKSNLNKLILIIHYLTMKILENNTTVKIIQNQNGLATIIDRE